MSGFADFIDQNYLPPSNQQEVHVIGTTLWINCPMRDGDNNPLNLSSGYTAKCTPYVKGGIALPTFTQTLTSGRVILLNNDQAQYQVAITATPAASIAMFAPYAGKTAKITCLLTRTLDNATIAVFRDCDLVLRPALNP